MRNLGWNIEVISFSYIFTLEVKMHEKERKCFHNCFKLQVNQNINMTLSVRSVSLYKYFYALDPHGSIYVCLFHILSKLDHRNDYRPTS